MATSKSSSSAGRAPWYRRWFSGSASTLTVETPAPSRPNVMFCCQECGFSSKLRGVVYDHIKSFHKEILDRHGHISEQVQPPA